MGRVTPPAAGTPGFGPDVTAFYDGLEADNTREYWQAHRAVFDDQVAAPLRALGEALTPEFGAVKIFRPNRDVRFSSDKSPYKTQAGMTAWGLAAGCYVAASADGVFLGGGMYSAQTDQARRMRSATADDRTGPALHRAVDALRRAGWELSGDRLVRVPKPWDDAHPRADLLHAKTLTAGRMLPWSAQLRGPGLVGTVATHWRELGPLVRWLERHVGPSDRPASRPGGRD